MAFGGLQRDYIDRLQACYRRILYKWATSNRPTVPTKILTSKVRAHVYTRTATVASLVGW